MHILKLFEQVLVVLEVIKPISNTDTPFPSHCDPLEPMNRQTANMALKRMGFKDILVANGMNFIASTFLNEKGLQPDVIEAALVHIEPFSVS